MYKFDDDDAGCIPTHAGMQDACIPGGARLNERSPVLVQINMLVRRKRTKSWHLTYFELKI